MPTVIVVGAGYAGLGAASTLAKAGLENLHIIVLEGNDRVRPSLVTPCLHVAAGAQTARSCGSQQRVLGTLTHSLAVAAACTCRVRMRCSWPRGQ